MINLRELLDKLCFFKDSFIPTSKENSPVLKNMYRACTWFTRSNELASYNWIGYAYTTFGWYVYNNLCNYIPIFLTLTLYYSEKVILLIFGKIIYSVFLSHNFTNLVYGYIKLLKLGSGLWIKKFFGRLLKCLTKMPHLSETFNSSNLPPGCCCKKVYNLMNATKKHLNLKAWTRLQE